MITASAKIKKSQIRAKVFRASTGKWEDLGVIAKTEGRFKKFIRKIKTLLWQQS